MPKSPKPVGIGSVPRPRGKAAASLQKQKEKDLYRFSRETPDEEIYRLVANLVDEPDRVAAIVAASFLERAIEDTIVSRLKRQDKETLGKLFEDSGSGPLATFDAKIRMAYALGVYGPTTKHDFDVIRRIRNAFAHSIIDVSFDTDEVKNAVASLKGDVLIGIRKTLTDLGDIPSMRRREYVGAVAIYHSNLVVFGRYTPEQLPKGLGAYPHFP